MAGTIDDRAVEVIRRSFELAKLDPSEAAVRLRTAGGSIQSRFVTQPQEGDVTVERDGIRAFIAPDLASRSPSFVVTVTEEHDTLTVVPG